MIEPSIKTQSTRRQLGKAHPKGRITHLTRNRIAVGITNTLAFVPSSCVPDTPKSRARHPVRIQHRCHLAPEHQISKPHNACCNTPCAISPAGGHRRHPIDKFRFADRRQGDCRVHVIHAGALYKDSTHHPMATV